MFEKACVSSLSLFLFLAYFCLHAKGWSGNGDWGAGPLLPKDKRETIVSTEYGEISAAQVSDGTRRGSYHLQFFTLEPNSLFLPVLLHRDMVFYVHTGSGKLNWANEEEEKTRLTALRRGDVYRLKPGTVFYLQSNLESEREKLRIFAIFVNLEDGELNEVSSIGAYSSISDLVRGFDKNVLQAAFQVPEELIEAITNATKPPAIVHDVPARKENLWGWEARFLKAFIGSQGHSMYDLENKKKAAKTFNIRDADPDFENCNGRSLTVTTKDMKVLKGSDIGIFMVNLTKGSMMGPHWNPMATEIAVVIEGQGMVRVVCSSNTTKSSSSNGTKFKCENRRFRVEEGDVFVVPRFHPMAQMSFNNGSLVFMGFSTASKLNHPQFLAGESSVLRTLDKDVLAAAFNVSNTTMDQFLTPQRESIILDCTSCAEEEARIMEEEIAKKRQEEKARKEEEERKRKEEEEARKEEEEKKREEEEARKREEEEARKREEEEKRREEGEAEARKREEEEARKREEEEKRREEEEAEARKREEEEAEARKREEEEAKEEDRRREAAAEREQEEAMREEEERQKREREEEKYEKEKKREEEEGKARKREEEETKKQEDRRREAAAEREQEEAMRGEEERQKREKEEVKYEIGAGGEGKRVEY